MNRNIPGAKSENFNAPGIFVFLIIKCGER